MKIPSLSTILESGLRTLRRFPLALADAIVGTIVALILVDWTGEKDATWWQLNNLFVASTPGIALFIAASLSGERRRWNLTAGSGVQGLVLVLLVLYGFSLPRDIYGPPYLYGIRHWLLLIGVHLLAAFAPFAGKGDANGFWQYNKTLFLRLLTALLYTGVLWAGFSIALAAVDHLFLVDVRPERYLELGILLAGVFNTWFFLSGVPENLDGLEQERAYPKGLKVFTQYVLLPLVVVYVLILYAYVFKIIVEWDWPKGWVANLILGFSITGIFSLLLVHPLRGKEGVAWISRFARAYYIALIPLIVVLLLAIIRRITEYGITENRYFVLVLGVWLAAVTVYCVAARSPGIKVIPASLCALAFLVAFGPWGAFQVSERSQMERLSGILAEAGVLRDGRVVPPVKPIPATASRDVSSIVRYLCEVHGPSALQPWFDTPLDTLGLSGPQEERSFGGEGQARALVALMGIAYVSRTESGGFTPRRLAAVKAFSYEVQGFSELYPALLLKEGESRQVTLVPGGDTLVLRLRGHSLSVSPGSGSGDTVSIDLETFARALVREFPNPYALPTDRMVIDASVGGRHLRMYVRSMVMKGEDRPGDVDRVEADVLVGKTKE